MENNKEKNEEKNTLDYFIEFAHTSTVSQFGKELNSFAFNLWQLFDKFKKTTFYIYNNRATVDPEVMDCIIREKGNENVNNGEVSDEYVADEWANVDELSGAELVYFDNIRIV